MVKDWREEFKNEFSGQTSLSQAILGALEYRGFYDAGKYLDDDIADAIIPHIQPFIENLLTQERNEIVERIGKIKVRADSKEDKGVADLYRDIWEKEFKPLVLSLIRSKLSE